jgi:phenylacetate-CoA ligase
VPIFQPELETLPRPELERLQRDRLRERFGVEFEALSELPFRVKSELRDAYPFGLLQAPLEECVRIHASSGTRGKATIVAYTRADLAAWADCCARALAAAGAGPGTIVHNAYGYGLFTGGLGLHYGAERLGCTVVPASGGNTPRQAQLLEDLGAEILCCTPSYALAIADHVSEPARLNLRAGLFGAEPWTEGLREAIEHALELTAVDIYGLSEVMGPGVSAECAEARDGAHVNEDHFLVEVVDPESGTPLPEGEVGELVFSTLTKEALPLLRYRTGDLASLTREPCPCGRTFARMSRVLGRTDDMLIIRGVNVFPSEIEAVVLEHSALGGQYAIVVDRRRALAGLEVRCELHAGGDRTAVAGELRARLHERLRLRVEVTVLEPGGLPRQVTGKARRVWERLDDADPLSRS